MLQGTTDQAQNGERGKRNMQHIVLLFFFSICTLLALWTGFDWKKIWSRHWKRRRLPWNTEREAGWISWHLHIFACYGIIWHHFTLLLIFLLPLCPPEGGANIFGEKLQDSMQSKRLLDSASLRTSSWFIQPWNSPHSIFKSLFLNGDLHKKSIIKLELVARSPLTQQKGHWKVITNCNLTLSMLQGTTDQAQNGERGKRNMQHIVLLFFFLHFALCWHCGPALIEKKSDLGIGRGRQATLKHWKGGRLNFMTFTYICMLWNHMTSFSPFCWFPSATLSPEGGATSSARNYRIRCSQRGLLDSASLRDIFLVYSTMNSPHSIFKSLFLNGDLHKKAS